MEHQMIAIIQGFLHPGDKCISFLQAGRVENWVKTNRILILVEHSGEFGLLICNPSKPIVTNKDDLTTEKALPINDVFKCSIDTSDSDLNQANPDTYIKICYLKEKLLFEASFTQKVNAFVHHVAKALETSSLKVDATPQFHWLKSYLPLISEDCLLDPLLYTPTVVPGREKHENWVKFDDESSDLVAFEEGQQSPFLNVENTIEPCSSNNTSPKAPPRRTKKAIEELPSPDFGNLPRESIALGATPLAARESVIRLQMTMREDHYTDLQNFSIFVGTWNVNGQYPSCSIRDWLAYDVAPPDIYAIGFQELDLSKEVFLFSDSPRQEEWYHAVTNGLNSKTKYTPVKLVRLIGMMLIVLVQEKHVAHVRNVGAETVGTGIMGKLGNKGGVAIRFDFHATTLCFVNSHLAAHVEEYERRNQDFNDICSRLAFSNFRPPKQIKEHDQIYWLGDMNYRIMDLSTDHVKQLIDKQNYAILLEHDQLNIQKNQKKIFVGFKEGAIKFNPTYKYNTGTNDWDSSEKHRPPAWCDRILWKGEHIRQLEYRSHPTLLISDHKPVSGLFSSQIKVINTVNFQRIYQEVMKSLDKLENEFLPQATVDKQEVLFDKVTFFDPSVRILTIANTGQVPVQFEFIKKLNDTTYCKEWLTISPFTECIKPGEKCDVELRLYVDKKTAYKLNSGIDKLYDILVLHLHRGKDIFITITGTYEPSCFGASLEALTKISHPIREVPIAKLIDLEVQPVGKPIEDQLFDIPKEIWLLVDYLSRYGLTQEELFEQPGLHSDIERIRERLDTGWSELVAASIHSVAEALLLFLESLAEPVIPYSFHQRCLDHANNFSLCKQIINDMPKVHRNVFRYLVLFLRELIKHGAYNKLDAKILSSIFGSIFLRTSPSDENLSVTYRRMNNQMLERKKTTFLLHFLLADYLDFGEKS